MSTSLRYHTFNIRDVEYRATQYVGNTVIFKTEVSSTSKVRSCYQSKKVIIKGRSTHFFNLPPLGRKRCILKLIMHRLCCKDCGLLFWPRLPFMHGNKRYTRSFAITALDLLQFATIKAVAECLNVRGDLIKQIHKQKLRVMYRHQYQNMKDLVYLGIDIFSICKDHSYMTIFMNLQTGRIIHAIEGRSFDVVAPFMQTIRI